MALIATETVQIREWTGDFGRQYTDRNDYTFAELDALYDGHYGITRRELNQRFLQDIPRSARILEVGCNIGNQLLTLQEMGFTNLTGIEVQSYAVDLARSRVPDVEFALASALAIPYPDDDFDLVFTSGVLIHIAPQDLPSALDEIHRCSRTWIWGMEYYAPQMTSICYHGHNSMLWKTDYAQLYRERFPSLELVREEHLRYLQNENIDAMFLLRQKALLPNDKGEA